MTGEGKAATEQEIAYGIVLRQSVRPSVVCL